MEFTRLASEASGVGGRFRERLRILLARVSCGLRIFFSIGLASHAVIGEVVAGESEHKPAFELPRGFVYLRDVDPSIAQDMRYATSRNFLGRPVTGYLAQECILTKAAAEALGRVQKALPQGKSLKVYDCYRPRMAVLDFMEWTQNAEDQKRKREHYPTLEKSRLIGLGYISTQSAHSRGSAVDLTIISISGPPSSAVTRQEPECHKPGPDGDGDLDFGTTYDCFHELSATAHPGIRGPARDNRELLVREMSRAGFTNYQREWWHFDLRDEPFDSAFNFPVLARPADVRSGYPGEPATDSLPKLQIDFGAENSCGGRAILGLLCLERHASVPAHVAPSQSEPVAVHLSASKTGYICLRCTGSMGLRDYMALEPVAKLLARPPWCLVASKGEGAGEPEKLLGWVVGSALALEPVDKVDCRK